jgi:hypothetical protein
LLGAEGCKEGEKCRIQRLEWGLLIVLRRVLDVREGEEGELFSKKYQYSKNEFSDNNVSTVRTSS